MTSDGNKILLQIRARYPIVYVVSWEEERILYELKTLVSKLGVWSVTKGLTFNNRPVDGFGLECPTGQPEIEILKHILDHSTPEGVYVLLDFHRYLGDGKNVLGNPIVERLLRDAARELPSQKKSIVIIAPLQNIPTELSKEVSVVDFALPSECEIAAILDNLLQSVSCYDKVAKKYLVPVPQNGEREAIIKACMGLTKMECENALSKTIVEFKRFDIPSIIREKEQIIKKAGVVNLITEVPPMTGVGGLENMKKFGRQRKKLFTNKAREDGIPLPKGVIVLGHPGCGKTLFAKALAAEWGMPLLSIEMDMIMAGQVGASEQNMSRVTHTAEAVSPCVMLIDEMEKAFAGMGSSDMSDSGTKAGVLKKFLSWSSDKTKPVFIVGTCNDVTQLRPEFLRKGRFDEIFFVDLPTKVERAEILKIHIKKQLRCPENFGIPELVEATNQFSGAEIEAVISVAHITAFDEDREFTTQDIVNACKETQGIAKTMKEEIKRRREWARDRARPASIQEVQETERQLDM